MDIQGNTDFTELQQLPMIEKDEQIRLLCLEMAVRLVGKFGGSGGSAIEMAKLFERWVQGQE